MVHGTGTHDGAVVGDRSVELRVAATVENLAVLRALVSAVATFEDLDFDAVSDLRLAVDEAATRLMRSAAPGSALLVRVEPREDAVVVRASTTCEVDEETIVAPGSFSWHVLKSLTDEVSTFNEANNVFGISLTARRASLLQ
ncbi:anti-sigma factor [Mycobacterium sp. ITM-2016-00316]|uniref:ATP-binding protein n=1 Tax=Mycobacterium sp. ITM-2016-00316 TaxID=2099695 RepID=UPI000CF9C5E5|nr:ATP-binding protein [Mycobacterium sp. ITM-2016-00316]WNG83285.1 anti-sigma factor [Mycobacterium sp. ITM-2016-00316]